MRQLRQNPTNVFLLISTSKSFESKWIEWSDIEALSQFCKISKSEFCEFSSKSENVLGMNVWHRIKALFAAGQLCYTTNFSTKTQVFTKLRAGKRKNPRNYESHIIEIFKEKSKPCFQNFCLWERFLPIPSRQIRAAVQKSSPLPWEHSIQNQNCTLDQNQIIKTDWRI